MVARWGIRFGTSLVGIAVGIILSGAVLSRFSINATAVVEATLLFWVIHLVVQLLALRVLVHEPAIALAGLLALASTIVALIIVNAIVSGLTMHGIQTYVFATLIIWITTSAGDIIGRQMIRTRRKERREAVRRPIFPLARALRHSIVSAGLLPQERCGSRRQWLSDGC